MYNFDYEHLKQTMIKATEQAFAHVKKVTEGESLYVFGLYTTDEWVYICSTANTEEGLRKKETEYVQRGYDIRENDLRWNPCDWIYHLEGIDFFNDVDKIMHYRSQYFNQDRRYLTEEYERDNERILQTCIEALGELDRKFIF